MDAAEFSEKAARNDDNKERNKLINKAINKGGGARKTICDFSPQNGDNGSNDPVLCPTPPPI